MRSKTCWTGWINDQTRHSDTIARRRTRDAASAGKDLARAHASTTDRRVADEERFPAGRRPQVQLPCRTHPRLEWRYGLHGARNPSLPTPRLQLERFRRPSAGWPEDGRHLDAQAEPERNPCPHGAIRLPAARRSRLSRHGRRLAAHPWEA